MTAPLVRRLLIDLEKPIDRHWCAGDAFLTAFFNALSMSFPIGEQFFIDSVRNGLKALPPDKQTALQGEVQGFVGQEATHRRIHTLFNQHLKDQGLHNAWEPRAAKRMAIMDNADPRHPLAVTAANEHFTALLAEWLLARPEVLDGSEDRLKAMWLWHSAEEAEHKNTAFDLYEALDGSLEWRSKWMKRVTWIFLSDAVRQTVHNLHTDGSLWRWSTWSSAWHHLLGKQGLLRLSYQPWREYFQSDFHPHQQHSTLSERWLADNRELYRPVGQAA